MVSRILYPEVTDQDDDHLSDPGFTAHLQEVLSVPSETGFCGLPESMTKGALRIRYKRISLLFDLAPIRFTELPMLPRALVVSYTTFSPLPRQVGTVCFLWHYLSIAGTTCYVVSRSWCSDFPPRYIGTIVSFSLVYSGATIILEQFSQMMILSPLDTSTIICGRTVKWHPEQVPFLRSVATALPLLCSINL